jgi:tetratricopeptide (TPR) repeat protein
VLEGGVRRESEQVRITAQLIRVADQSRSGLGSTIARKNDVLRVQEISEEIGDQVELALDRRRSPPLRPSTLSPRNYAAYDEYLKGRHFWNLRSRDGFRSAIVSFQKAIEANPDDARSYAGLADAYGLIGTYNYAPQAEVVPKAREAALKALEIDADLAEAHTSLALPNEFFDWDWQSARDRFRRAIELQRTTPPLTIGTRSILPSKGGSAALGEIEHARELDPQSTVIAADTGAILYFSRQYDQAIEQFHSVFVLDPNNPRAHLIVPAYIGEGRLAEARAEVSRWVQVDDGPWPRAFAAYLDGRMSRPEEARLELGRMEELGRSLGEDPLERRTLAYVGMGLDGDALSCWSRPTGPGRFPRFGEGQPALRPLRQDPRFLDVLHHVGRSV